MSSHQSPARTAAHSLPWLGLVLASATFANTRVPPAPEKKDGPIAMNPGNTGAMKLINNSQCELSFATRMADTGFGSNPRTADARPRSGPNFKVNITVVSTARFSSATSDAVDFSVTPSLVTSGSGSLPGPITLKLVDRRETQFTTQAPGESGVGPMVAHTPLTFVAVNSPAPLQAGRTYALNKTWKPVAAVPWVSLPILFVEVSGAGVPAETYCYVQPPDVLPAFLVAPGGSAIKPPPSKK